MTTKITKTRAAGTVQRWIDEPNTFYTEVLGLAMYDKQVEIAEAVNKHSQVAVVGCNSSGKDWHTGALILQWLNTRRPAKVVVIGPTYKQIADIVWKDTRNHFYNSKVPLGGEMYKPPRYEISDDQYAVGISTDNPYNIDGVHSPNLLVIITEAHHVKQDHIDAAKRLGPNRLLLTGNPFCAAGEFYEAFHANAGAYHTIEIDAEDTPNVQQGVEVIPGLVTSEWVERRKKDWGETSPMFIASVHGKFPPNLTVGLVARATLMEAVDRELEPEAGDWKTLSCDVARFGDDDTVVWSRQGHQVRFVRRVHGWDTQQVAGMLKKMCEDPEDDYYQEDVRTIIIDDTGLGGGVTDRLREEGVLEGQCRILAFIGGENARENRRFVNAVAECWYELAQAAKDGMLDLGQDSQVMVGQMSSRLYTIQGDKRIKLEEKAAYKSRIGGKSPDDADAAAMLYSPLMHGEVGIWL